MLNAISHESYHEFNGKRMWDITGKLWQYTRDTVENCENHNGARLLFGGTNVADYSCKNYLRPVFYHHIHSHVFGLRLIRRKKTSLYKADTTHYPKIQLSWDQTDELIDKNWVWEPQLKVLLFVGDGMPWLHIHRYSEATRHTLDVLSNKSEGKTYYDKDFDFSYTGIQDLTVFMFLPQLEKLNLSWNEIQDISPLAHLPNLVELRLHRNQIRDISPLMSLKNLNDLMLGSNPIQDLTPLKMLKNLKRLWLDKDQIERLHAREILPDVEIMEM